MYATQEGYAAANGASVESLLNAAGTQFAAFERLSALNFDFAKSAFDETVTCTKLLLEGKDTDELVSVVAGAIPPAVERVTAYTRVVSEIALRAQLDMKKLAEAMASEYGKYIIGHFNALSGNAPTDHAAAIDAVDSALAAARSAYDAMSGTTEEAPEPAESNAADTSSKAKNSKKKAA